MRKFTIGILIVLVCAGTFVFTACKEEKTAEKPVVQEDLTPFAGDWECEDNPLNDPDNYTGYLKLEITKDGKFTIYDDEAGNPGIKGTLKITSDKELELTCTGDADFDPPSTWYDMKKKQTLAYKFKSEEKLYLTYESEEEDIQSTLIFDKVKK